MHPLRLNQDSIDVIRSASLAAYPAEACGLLLGRRSTDRDEVVLSTSARNLAEDPRRFELHPEDFLAAELQAEALNLRVLGVWHSHPDEPATPSESDRTGAHANWHYLIASTTAKRVETLRDWVLNTGRFSERPLMFVQVAEHRSTSTDFEPER